MPGFLKPISSLAAIYCQGICLRFFCLGFSAGLPLLLVIGTLSFWLREAGVDLTTIGFMSWIGLIYGCKWLWAPFIDSVPVPWLSRKLGQRRAWLLIAQIGVIAGLLGLAFNDPKQSLMVTAAFAMLTAFSSATQDISLDAYRIESADVSMQGALAASYQTGYRLAMIWAGAGAFALAAFYAESDAYSHASWTFAYSVMAASMLVGAATTLLSPTTETNCDKSAEKPFRRFSLKGLKTLCVTPFTDFLVRYRWHAALILALIATYRISDVVMGVMSNPFYLDMGFTKQEIAAISKIFGVVMTLAGAFTGGALVMKFGVFKTLFLGAALSSLTNLLFSMLALIGHSVPFLVATVSADNLAGGIASAAFVAYLSGLTNQKYSATQYALFSSIMLMLPKLTAGFSGMMVESMGYQAFFTLTAAMGIPVLLLIPFASKARPGQDGKQ